MRGGADVGRWDVGRWDVGAWAALARWTAGALALSAAIGWTTGWEPATRLLPGGATLKANTALAVACLAWASRRAPPRATDVPPLLVAAGLVSVALVEWATGTSTGVGEWLVDDPASRAAGQPPGRMAVATAIGLLAIAGAIVAAHPRPRLSQACALLAMGVGWVAAVGIAAESSALWSVAWYGTVSAPTAASLVLLGGATLALTRDRGWLPAVFGADAGAVLVRRMLPAVIAIPTLTAVAAGWIVSGLAVQPGFGVAVAVTLDAALLLLALAPVVRAARADEAVRVAAEAAISAHRTRLAELSQALMDVHEAERRRLAHELHDELGQQLTALSLAIERAGADPSALDGAAAAVRGLSHDVRSLAYELRPAMLDDLGLGPALRWLAGRYPGLIVEVAIAEPLGRFAPAVETAAYRIAQEALTNVARHAGTSSAELIVGVVGDRLVIEVLDRGPGLGGRPSGFGLLGMRERAEHLGGTFEVRSAPGSTAVRAALPAQAAQP